MSFSFSSTSIENLKDRLDIVDVIGQAVQLKRAGSNFKGLCPFHNEKTPSFVVSQTKQYFTCFGCGASGDVIEFTKRYYNMDFPEAVEKLAEEHGIELEKSRFDDNRKEYYEINRMAARFFYDSFTKKANVGYAYMRNRQIADATLKKFGIGYADAEWDSLYRYLHSQGVPDDKMLELGLISRGKNGKCYDRFRNRVMFPIINTSGKVIGFGGRAISSEDNPKYLNSPESIVFQKKNNLYGLNLSRQEAGKSGYIILVEGYMDVIGLYQAGVRNVAASLGTALTDNQGRLLHRYVKDVVLSYDADKAGRAAALRGIEILRNEGIKVRVLHVDDGKDPDEYIKHNGQDAFLKLVDGALAYGDYKLESAKVGYDLTNDQGRLDYMNAAVGIIAGMNPIEQEIYKNKLSHDAGISESAIDRELRRRSVQVRPREEREHHGEETQKLTTTPLERTLIKLSFTDARYVERIRRDMPEQVTDFMGRILELLLAYSNEDGLVDRNKVVDEMGAASAYLAAVLDKTIVDSDYEQVYRECMRTARGEKLAKMEKDILTRLSLADEENNEDKILELTDQLMHIQRERKQL